MKPRPPRRIVAFLVALIALPTLGVSSLVGCSQQEVQAFREAMAEKNQEIKQLDTQIEKLETDLAFAEVMGDDELTQKLQHGIDVLKQTKFTVEAEVDEFLAATVNAEDGFEVGAEASRQSAKYLPPPYNLAALGVAAILGGISEYRRRRMKNAAEDLVIAIEKEKQPDGSVNFNKQAVELRSRMSPDARKLVDTAQAKAPAIVKALEPISFDPSNN